MSNRQVLDQGIAPNISGFDLRKFVDMFGVADYVSVEQSTLDLGETMTLAIIEWQQVIIDDLEKRVSALEVKG